MTTIILPLYSYKGKGHVWVYRCLFQPNVEGVPALWASLQCVRIELKAGWGTRGQPLRGRVFPYVPLRPGRKRPGYNIICQRHPGAGVFFSVIFSIQRGPLGEQRVRGGTPSRTQRKGPGRKGPGVSSKGQCSRHIRHCLVSSSLPRRRVDSFTYSS